MISICYGSFENSEARGDLIQLVGVGQALNSNRLVMLGTQAWPGGVFLALGPCRVWG